MCRDRFGEFDAFRFRFRFSDGRAGALGLTGAGGSIAMDVVEEDEEDAVVADADDEAAALDEGAGLAQGGSLDELAVGVEAASAASGDGSLITCVPLAWVGE